MGSPAEPRPGVAAARKWSSISLLVLMGLARCGQSGPFAEPLSEDERLMRELRTIAAELPPREAPFMEVDLDDPTDQVGPALRAALLRAQRSEGTARIVVLGGSHVAGDLVTAPIRRVLQQHFGDAGHGFVLPLPPYDHYWQSGVSVEEGEGWAVLEPSPKHRDVDDYGPLASAIEPVEAAFVTVEATAPASQVELWYWSRSEGGMLEVAIDGTALRIDTTSESSMAGSATVGMGEGTHRIEVRSDADAPTRLFGMVLERNVPGVIVDQMGMNGITPTMLLLSRPETSTAFLSHRHPDLLVLWLGGNESGEWWPIEHHREQLRALLARLREAVPDAACLVLGALDRRQLNRDGWVVPPTLEALFSAQHATALEAGCAFFDSVAWEGGLGAVERLEALEPSLMRPDRVHLVQRGYELYAGSLLRALVRATLEDHETSSHNTP